MERPELNRASAPITLACCLAAAGLLVVWLSPGQPESGDGVAHYMISRFAWAHAELLLNAWGKPVFTLLSSPFAQLGTWGMALFNAIVAACTAILIVRHTTRRDAAWGWAVPVLLFTSPYYAHTLMAGLTEPLFGLLTVLVVVLVREGNWRGGLALCSFLPFTRPEYVAFVPFVVLLAMHGKRFKELAFLLIGPVLAVLLGWILLDEPLYALFDPYAGVDTYGSGALDHFVRHLDEVLGWPLAIAALLSLLVWLPALRRNGSPGYPTVQLALLTIAPACGILAVHSYVWWKGGHGSLGLLRVLATVVPLLVLFCTDTLARVFPLELRGRAWRSLAIVPLVLLGTYGLWYNARTLHLPYPETVVDRTIRSVSEKAMALREPGQRLIYTSPSIGMYTGLDPQDTNVVMQLFGPEMLRKNRGTRDGDIVIWDSHHMRVDGHLPFATILDHPRFRLLERFLPDERTTVIGDVPFEMALFRCTSTSKRTEIDTLHALNGRTTDVLLEHQGETGPDSVLTTPPTEFPLTFTYRPEPGDATPQEDLYLQAELVDVQDTAALLLVMEAMEGNERVRYEVVKVQGTALNARFSILHHTPRSVVKIYLWNQARETLRIRQLRLIRRTIRQA